MLRRIAVALLALALFGVTGCSEGFVREISIDESSDTGQKSGHYLVDSSDLTWKLHGNWRMSRIEDKLKGLSDYDHQVFQGETTVRVRAEIRRIRLDLCADQIADALAESGWKKTSDLDGQIADKDGQGFEATRNDRYQQVWCFRSNHDAMVIIIVSTTESASAQPTVSSLLHQTIAWKN